MTGQIKEVDFAYYCKRCKYFKLPESEDPCDECLNNPGNLESTTPVNYREDKESIAKCVDNKNQKKK